MSSHPEVLSTAHTHTHTQSTQTQAQEVLQGVPFRGVHVLKGEKAHFAARKKGPESRKNEVKLRPPSVAWAF